MTVLSSALWMACGGDGGLHSGVAGDKKLEELTSSELEKICEAATRYRAAALPVALQVRAGCAQKGLLTNDLSACEAATMSCVDAFEDAQADAGDRGVSLPSATESFVCYAEAELGGCTASVAELEGCIETTFLLTSRALHSLRCDLLTRVTRPVSDTTTSGITVCQALDQKCPGLGNVSGRVRVVPPDPKPPDAGVDAGPPPGPITCDDLALQYDATRCAYSGCTAVQCACKPFARSFGVCNSVQGCLTALDCDAACAATSQSIVQTCAQSTTCSDDADCGDYRCAIGPSGTGSCTRGEGGDPCDDAADCKSELCSSGSSSTQTCAGDVAEGSPCTGDIQCQSGICYQISGFGSQGECSQGDSGDLCADDADCGSSICAYDSSLGSYHCSDGQSGAACQSDSDCISGRCATGGRSTSVCTDGLPGDPCDTGFDCGSGNCRTSPSTFESSCAHPPGEECPEGIADCNGDCRPAQTSCTGASCAASCGGSSCGTVTLATWNAADKQGNITLSNGDLNATTTTTNDAVRATLGETAATWYWEITLLSRGTSGYSPELGVTIMSAPLEDGLGHATVPGVGLRADGTLSASATGQRTLCAYAVDDVVGVALDVDAAMIYFSINGVWQGGANPESSEGGIAIDIAAESVFPIISLSTNDAFSANFGQSAFAHTPPSGFSPLYQ